MGNNTGEESSDKKNDDDKKDDPSERIFAKLKDLDDTEYEAKVIQIHTPGEHKINGQIYDMEIQLIFESVRGVMRQ